VCRRVGPTVDVGQEELIRLAVIGVSSATALHAGKAKRFDLAFSRHDGIVMDPVGDEILVRHRQTAVVVTAMVR
jgi:hypothetical protein